MEEHVSILAGILSCQLWCRTLQFSVTWRKSRLDSWLVVWGFAEDDKLTIAAEELLLALDVQRDASLDGTKRAWQKLALKLHPEKYPENSGVAEKNFTEVSKVLPDAKKWNDNGKSMEAVLRGKKTKRGGSKP